MKINKNSLGYKLKNEYWEDAYIFLIKNGKVYYNGFAKNIPLFLYDAIVVKESIIYSGYKLEIIM